MAAPCVKAKDGDRVVGVRLSDTLRRELLRAGYVEGRDFHAYVEVPHPTLLDEAYRRVKRPLVRILEDLLGNIEAQGLASRKELRRVRDVLEGAYGQYPTEVTSAECVAEKRAPYAAVQRLYGIRPVEGLRDVESVGIKPLWGTLILARGRALQIDLPVRGGASVASGAGDGAADGDRGFLTEADLRRRERENLLRVLERSGWRIKGAGGAAELLGVRPATLASRMKAMGIERPR